MPTLGDLAPEESTTTTPTTTPTWGQSLRRTAYRVGLPILGGITAGPFGGAGLGLAGEALAQADEISAGQRPEPNPYSLALAGATGLIPGAPAERIADPTLRLAARVGVGELTGAAVTTGQSLAERGRLPNRSELSLATGFGGAFGGVAGAISDRLTRTPKMAPASPAAPISVKPPAEEGGSARFTKLGTGVTPPPAVPRPAERLKGEQAAVDRLWGDLPPISREALRQLHADNADAIAEQARQQQPVERTMALAQDILFNPDRPVAKGTAYNAEQLVSIGNMVNTLQRKVDDLGAQVATGTADDLTKLNLQRAQQELVTSVVSHRGAKAEIGRALGILRYQTQAALSGDARMIQKASRMGVGADEISRVLQMTDPTDDIGRFRLLMNMRKPGFRDQVKWYYLTSILSGPKTHERNLIGNTFNLAYKMASTPIAAGVEKLTTPAVDREVFAGELPKQAVGALQAIPKASQKFLFMLKNGFSLDDVGTFEVKPPEMRGGIATNFVGRALGAADQFFKTLAGEAELRGGAYALARRTALREGLRGEGLQSRVSDLMATHLADPPPALVAQVGKAASRATFQEGAGKATRAIMAFRDALPGMEFVLPFIRTPANIMKQSVQATPLGFATSLGRESGRLGVQARGEAALGTVLLAPLAYLAATGKLSGSGPKDQAERDALYVQGWLPNAVKIGDHWVSYQQFQPVALAASAMANGFEAWRDAKKSKKPLDATQIAGAIAGKVAKSQLQQSYVASLFDIVNAVEDPAGWGAGTLHRYAGSAVPLSGAVRTVAQTMDPIVREPGNITEAVKSQIPGLSQTVPPKLTAGGRPALRKTSPLVAPDVTTIKNDPIRQELARLNMRLPIPQVGQMRMGNVDMALSPEQQFAYRQAKGVAVYRGVQDFMSRAGYRNMNDDQRQIALGKIIRQKQDQIEGRAKMLHRQAFSAADLLR